MRRFTKLPLDLKGTNPTNRIQNEPHYLTRVADRPHRVLIPKMGCFYQDPDLKLVDHGRLLKLGEDYTTTYLYPELSKLSTKPIYAFIVVTNPEVSDQLTIDYRAVGGPFGLDISELADILRTIEEGDGVRIDFKDIINKPKAYNPLDHFDEYWQLYGAENTVTVINRIGDVAATGIQYVEEDLRDYIARNEAIVTDLVRQHEDLLEDHKRDRNNPHQDNKHSVGLGNVNNWPMATREEHIARTIDNKYTNAYGGYEAIQQVPAVALFNHVNDFNNPHQTRAEDINAYTITQLNSLLATKLNTTGTAYDSSKIYGQTPAEFKTYAMANLNGTLFTKGLVNPARMGTGSSSSTTLLMGDGEFKTIQSLIEWAAPLRPGARVVSIRTSQATSTTAAINHARVTFANINEYPVGSLAIYHAPNNVGETSQVGTLWETKVLVRNTSGWSTLVP